MLTIASDLIVAIVKYPFWGEVISLLLILCFLLELRLLILKLIKLINYLKGGEIMGKEESKVVKDNGDKVKPQEKAKVEKVKEEPKKPVFKAGNRVKVKDSNSKGLKPYSGREGTVVSIDESDFPVKVKFDKTVGKAKKVYGFKKDEIESIIGRPKGS
jgi:hypothetical protein